MKLLRVNEPRVRDGHPFYRDYFENKVTFNQIMKNNFDFVLLEVPYFLVKL